MSYECHIGATSEHMHERIGFRMLNNLLKSAFKDNKKHVVLLGSFRVEKAPIDAAIITENALILIDLKDYQGTLIEANPSDPWHCTERHKKKVEIKGGSQSKGPKNPYQQITNYRKIFINYFSNALRKDPIPGLIHSQSMIYFTRKMDGVKDIWLDNFKRQKKTFFISTKSSILGDISDINNDKIKITRNHIHSIRITLGLKPYEDSDKFDEITNQENVKLVDKYEKLQKERNAYKKLSEDRELNLEKERLRADTEKQRRIEIEKILKERDLKPKEETAFKQEVIVAEKGGKDIVYSPTLNLIAVNTDVAHGRLRNLCTELVFSDGQKKYIKLETFDSKLKVTNKAKELIGKNVQVSTWVSEDVDWIKKGYFNNIYESNKPVERGKIISFSAPQSVKILKVSIVNGREYKSNWSKPMYEIQTEMGTFIAATIKNHQPLEKQRRFVEWDKEQGKTVKVWTYSDTQVKELYWINLYPGIKPFEEP